MSRRFTHYAENAACLFAVALRRSRFFSLSRRHFGGIAVFILLFHSTHDQHQLKKV